MVNINLHQTSRQEKTVQRKDRALNSGFIISIIILSTSFLVFFGIKICRSVIENKITTVKSQMDMEMKNINESRMSKVVDFQMRLEEIGAGISSKKNSKETLAKIESLIVPGVMLVSYEYDGAKKYLVLEAISDNFQIISKQMLNLKNSDYFGDVSVSETNLGKDGKVKFTLESQIVFKGNN